MGPVPPTAALAAEGVSIWLDDLSHDCILSGGLESLIASGVQRAETVEKALRGVR